ncbi:tetratricopeptide repeat protein [Streptomyces erythrochromogenes]|uniref:tetratricopeptide repeat protein n=1 Tax=Streptomyces erythrochromogenes TaxID=285574 RepID=UPI003820F0AD
MEARVAAAVPACDDPDCGRLPLEPSNAFPLLAAVRERQGRIEEAIAVMRTLADRPGGAEDWIVHTLCELYADQGRARDGLAYLDALKARRGGAEDGEFFRMRLALMADCGLLDEAIEQARAHPEGDTWYAARSLSGLLAGTGCTEEAAAVLERHPDSNASLRAEHLIDLGRIKEAVQVLQRRPRTAPIDDPWAGSPSSEPPF